MQYNYLWTTGLTMNATKILDKYPVQTRERYILTIRRQCSQFYDAKIFNVNVVNMQWFD